MEALLDFFFFFGHMGKKKKRKERKERETNRPLKQKLMMMMFFFFFLFITYGNSYCFFVASIFSSIGFIFVYPSGDVWHWMLYIRGPNTCL